LASEKALASYKEALKKAPNDVDLIVYGSCSNDETVPNSASGVQVRLGAVNAASRRAMAWSM
jgi:3-oxoacyl-[acyl-carrier-protein] synthase-3